ncbi:MAG TPA: hypothetical protein DDY29_08715 [Rhodobacteraceae bacterium]|jgi:uncharacterized membrane protein|nr:hypothetical protein [Paracoccaceae bacterium]
MEGQAMTDEPPGGTPAETPRAAPEPPPQDPFLPPKIVYGLYALGYFVGITALAGVIYAYLERGKNPEVDSHLTFQIETFWYSLLIFFAGILTAFIVVGLFILLFLLVWGLTRVISGFVLANDGKPVSGTRFLGMIAQ